MNYIEKMLQDYCPNGVEWKELGEVCVVNKGKQLNKTFLVDDGQYPAYNGGKTYSGRTDSYNVTENTIIISQGGASAGFVNFVTTKFWANAHCYYLLPDITRVNNRYLYHFLKMKQSYLMDFQHGAGIPALKSDKITKMPLPLPPLKIQEEIVQILDKFTEYVTELTAELTDRQKQYSFYRDKLLSFEDEVYQVEWKTMGEVAENLDYLRKPVTKGSRSSGIYPYYGASGIVDFVDDYIFDGEFLLVSEDGANLIARKTPIAFPINGRTWVNNHAHVLKFESQIDQKFVSYYLNHIDLSPYISGAAQPKLNKQNLNSILLPYPNEQIRKRIVQVLDNFDAVCNDLNIGLPKEIELRQKQYEYFREKLLTFTAEGVYPGQWTVDSEWGPSDLIRLLNWVFGPIRVQLGAICDFTRGNGLQKKDFTEEGFPVIHYGQIYTRYGFSTKDTVSFTSQTVFDKLKKAQSNDIVMATTSENVEDVGKAVVWEGEEVIGVSGDSYIIQTSQNARYLNYFFKSVHFQSQKEKKVTGTKVIRINAKDMEKFVINIPSLEDQSHIVSVLDAFDTLTNSIAEGLPKEIELRQKQYEFFREQLLSF